VTDFLYPFIEGDERDAAALLDELARSAAAKTEASLALRDATLRALDAPLDAVAAAMTARFAGGGRLFTFGNGGSATDAGACAALFADPPAGAGRPARSLAADPAIITALANDVGFELVFARQLMAAARGGDIALGLSTSGCSPNVLRAFSDAKRLGMLTVGIAGYDGGAMATHDAIDHCLVVRSDSVHRVQETQSAVVYELWRRLG
jgi:D-sedoheptulose 7-phosphate isomerase